MTASASVVDLKPCPFCGGKTSLHEGMGEFWARCDDCDATGSMRSRADRAVRDWNTRTTPQPAEQDAREAVARIEDDLRTRNLYDEGEGSPRLKVREDDLRTLLALTQAAPDGWRPIETHDGGDENVLIAESDGSVLEARLLDDGRGWWPRNNNPTDHWGQECFPTHWRPLPAPPAQGAGG